MYKSKSKKFIRDDYYSLIGCGLQIAKIKHVK